MITLRDYQTEAVQTLHKPEAYADSGCPLIVLPTGSGKSLVIAAFIKSVFQFPNQKVAIITHVQELIEQNASALTAYWPEADYGIYSAGLKRNDTDQPILFCGIQSVWKKAFHLGMLNLILVDEAHLINAKASGMYRFFLAEARRANPHARVVGFTATTFRMKSGSLTYGEDRIFTNIAYQKPIAELIDAGYLAPLTTKAMKTEFDLSGISIQGGEYAAGQLESAMDQAHLTNAALEEVIAYGATRKSWLFFCSGVDHAHHVRDALRNLGVTAETVTGKTSKGERKRIFQDFKAGDIRALTGMSVFTTGFDAPAVDLLIMLRPTKSPGLYVQMAGRGTRLAPGKTDCLVLDFAGNINEHGPIDQVQPWIPKKRKQKGAAPVKECPECHSVVHASILTCPDCGYQFPPNEEPKHDTKASQAAILSRDLDPMAGIKSVPVTEVVYSKHAKLFKPPSLRADYYNHISLVASEWVCLEHGGYPLEKAKRWWNERYDVLLASPPETVDLALEWKDGLRVPAAITIDTREKYHRIIRYDWPQKSVAA